MTEFIFYFRQSTRICERGALKCAYDIDPCRDVTSPSRSKFRERQGYFWPGLACADHNQPMATVRMSLNSGDHEIRIRLNGAVLVGFDKMAGKPRPL